jgi:hypothetical protein
MLTILDIHKLNAKDYYNLWEEFWYNKLGYYRKGMEKVCRILSVEEARKEDVILEKEFVEFYNNKINK